MMAFKLYKLEQIKEYIQKLPYFELKDIVVGDQEIKDFKAVCYRGTNKAVAIVSKRYKLVQHATVFQIFIEQLEKFFDNIEGYVSHTRTKAFLFLTVKERFVEGDSNYKVGFSISNSVDTTTAICTRFFTYRLVCSNGLIASDTIFKINQKHIANPHFYSILKDKISKTIQTFNRIEEREFNFYEEIKKVNLTIDQTKTILEKLNIAQKGLKVILTRINKVDNAFNVYQAITHYYSNFSSLNIGSIVQNTIKAREIIQNLIRR